MSRGIGIVLNLLVLTAALFAGWYSTTRVVYFAPSLLNQTLLCTDPDGLRSRQPVMDSFEVDWFGRELRAFEEPSLYLAARENRPEHTGTIRFLWLPTYHDPVVIRLDSMRNGDVQLTAKQHSSGAGFGGFRSPREMSRVLTTEESRQVEVVVRATALLEQPARGCRFGLHGSNWIVEAVDPTAGYVYINRWSAEDGPVHEFGMLLLGLTGWDFGEIY